MLRATSIAIGHICAMCASYATTKRTTAVSSTFFLFSIQLGNIFWGCGRTSSNIGQEGGQFNNRTYVSVTDIYPHMPVLRPHAAFHERRISSVTFTSANLYSNFYMRVGVARVLADSSDFGLLGEQSSQKWEIPCFGRR